MVDIDVGADEGSFVVLFDGASRTRTYTIRPGWTGDLLTDGSSGKGTLDLTTFDPRPGNLSIATAAKHSRLARGSARAGACGSDRRKGSARLRGPLRRPMERMVTALALVVALAAGAFPEDPIPTAAAARALREAEEAALADDGKLWGRSLVGPILLADPATHAAVANQPDEAGVLREVDGVFVGTLPAELGIANTAVEWGGVRWTMVAWPLPESRYARVRLLLHESFHRIQPELGHGGGDPLATHLDTEPGRVWMRLEMRALAEALVRRDDERRRALEDALVFRAHRRALFPGTAEREAAFERNEGLAEYTGLALCGLPPWVRADRAAQKLEQDERAESFVRSFAYATGPGYGTLLDELGASWRAKLGPSDDLAALAARAIGWSAPEDLAAEAGRRAGRHGGDEVAETEQRRAREKAELDARNRARFVDGPVLLLPLGGDVRYTFDPHAVASLGDSGNVYGSIRLVDSWGILDASGGALLARASTGAVSSAHVPAPPDAAARPLAGPGWTLELAPGWTLVPGERAGDWTVARAKRE